MTTAHSIPRNGMAVMLVVLVAQVKGVRFYDLRNSGLSKGERFTLMRQPGNANCVDVRIVRGRLLLGHLKAPLAACLSPLMLDLDGG